MLKQFFKKNFQRLNEKRKNFRDRRQKRIEIRRERRKQFWKKTKTVLKKPYIFLKVKLTGVNQSPKALIPKIKNKFTVSYRWIRIKLKRGYAYIVYFIITVGVAVILQFGGLIVPAASAQQFPTSATPVERVVRRSGDGNINSVTLTSKKEQGFGPIEPVDGGFVNSNIHNPRNPKQQNPNDGRIPFVGKQSLSANKNQPDLNQNLSKKDKRELREIDKDKKDAEKSARTRDKLEQQKLVKANSKVREAKSYRIESRIKDSKKLIAIAEKGGEDPEIQQDWNHSVEQAKGGNFDSGIGSEPIKGLKENVKEMRGSHGGRVLYVLKDDTCLILAKCDKASQKQTIEILKEMGY